MERLFWNIAGEYNKDTWIAVVYFILHGSYEFNNVLNAIPFGIIALLWIVATVIFSKIIFEKHQCKRN